MQPLRGSGANQPSCKACACTIGVDNNANPTLFQSRATRLTSDSCGTSPSEIMAAALIVVLPVVALFIALQRRFIEGMAGGSVKG